MTVYLIKHNFARSQPQWSAERTRLFGEENKGIPVEADSAEEALRDYCDEHNLNPWYVLAEEVKP